MLLSADVSVALDKDSLKVRHTGAKKQKSHQDRLRMFAFNLSVCTR